MFYKNEIIKDIDENYAVSNFGRVFSKPIVKGNRSDGLPHRRGWVELSQRLNPNGYPIVRINKVKKTVHRLVALCFIKKIKGKQFVDHINGIKYNNHVENLRWVTSKENTNYYWRNRCVTSVDCYTKEGVFIRTYNSIKEASIDTGVANPNIYSMINGNKYPKTAKGYIFKKSN